MRPHSPHNIKNELSLLLKQLTKNCDITWRKSVGNSFITTISIDTSTMTIECIPTGLLVTLCLLNTQEFFIWDNSIFDIIQSIWMKTKRPSEDDFKIMYEMLSEVKNKYSCERCGNTSIKENDDYCNICGSHV